MKIILDYLKIKVVIHVQLYYDNKSTNNIAHNTIGLHHNQCGHVVTTNVAIGSWEWSIFIYQLQGKCC